ncbi:hypothetical protein [Neobacillus drentensis]|uniref:hypothetical protein n=1 Tax=Neobacillus drentensis TaxID=220684 RepID=UPI0030002EA5
MLRLQNNKESGSAFNRGDIGRIIDWQAERSQRLGSFEPLGAAAGQRKSWPFWSAFFIQLKNSIKKFKNVIDVLYSWCYYIKAVVNDELTI